MRRGGRRPLGVSTANLPEKAARRLGNRVVLALDNYEVFRLMNSWLRQVFVPLLGDTVRVLLFGRQPPVPAWATTAAQQLPVATEEARQLR
jgi:hypothetical protein